MENRAIEELRSNKRAQTLRLMEASGLTRQIAEAAERRDEVAMQMLLGEREEPLRAAQEIEERIRVYLQTLPENEAIRMSALLKGAKAEREEEAAFAEQVAQYHRLLETIIAEDKRLSVKLGGSRSFYKMFRE